MKICDAAQLRRRVRGVGPAGRRARAGRPRPRVGGRGLRLRRGQLHGLPRREDRPGADRVGHPAALHAHADAARHDRGRPRRALRRSCRPRARRVGPAGDRGLARRPVRQAARPHPRDHRHLPQGLEARGAAHQRRADVPACRCRRDRAPASASRSRSSAIRCATASRSTSRRSARRTSRSPPRWPTAGCRCSSCPRRRRTCSVRRSRPARRSVDPTSVPLDICAGGLVCITDDKAEAESVRDLGRAMAALYIGGMGAKGQNFYNALARRYGYEQEAEEIQDLYLAGHKQEAAAKVPRSCSSSRRCAAPRASSRSASPPTRKRASPSSRSRPFGERPAEIVEKLKAWSE